MKYFVVLLFVSLLGDLNFFQQATMKTCEVSVIMIKHALILTAYKDIDFLKELCKVYACYFSVYVHIDKKSEIPKLDLEYLNSIENVTAISRYKINWGSYLHIQAYIDLLELAKLDDIQYVHILSANTILARRPDKLFDFFEKHPKDIFMEVLYDDGNNFSQFGYRYYGFFFEHIYNTRGKFSKVLSRVEKLCGGIQAKIKLRRNVKFEWKGYIYCHMPMDAVRYVLSYCAENPHYLKELKYCYVGEEFFFQYNYEFGMEIEGI